MCSSDVACDVDRIQDLRAASLALRGEPDHAVWVLVVQRPQQHGIDHAVDRGGQADAERERDDNGG
jgi:hypothetical protein